MTGNAVSRQHVTCPCWELPGHVVVVITITFVVVSGTGTVVGGGAVGVTIILVVFEKVSVLVRVTGIVTGVELIVVVLKVTLKC